jgi:hypothetical protein
VQPTTKTLARIACVTALGAIVAEPAIAETHYMQLYEDFATASCVNTVSCQVEFKRAVDHIKVLSVSCNFFNVTSDPPLTANVNGLALGRLASNGSVPRPECRAVPSHSLDTACRSEDVEAGRGGQFQRAGLHRDALQHLGPGEQSLTEEARWSRCGPTGSIAPRPDRLTSAAPQLGRRGWK